MRKSDIILRGYDDHGPGAQPMVNVKVDFPYPHGIPALAKQVAVDAGADVIEAAFFADWITEHNNAGTLDPDSEWFNAACEDGWEQLQSHTNAEDGPYPGWDVKVYAAGRSGGWAYIEGLPDFESWDATMVSRWAAFASIARSYADDVPYQMLAMIYLNEWEPMREAHREASKAMLAGLGL